MSDRHAQGDRAERALRDAFAARAAEPAFAPFDPEQLARAASGQGRLAPLPAEDVRRSVTATGRPHRAVGTWLTAAAAAVVLAVPAGVWLAGLGGPATQDAPMAGTAAEAGSARTSGEDSGMTGPAGAAPVPEEVRSERLLGAVVDVPQGWGVADAPHEGWCAEPGWVPPPGPFVDASPGARDALADCVVVPEPERRTHVTARPADPGGDDVRPVVDGGWVGLSRVVRDTVVTVWVPAGDEAVAEGVLATAREA